MADYFYNDTKVTCDVIRDLMPLVADRVASEDSVLLLEGHLENCSECSELYNEMCIPKSEPSVAATDDKRIMSYIRRRFVLLAALIMMIGAVVGVLFIDTEFILQNILLMPAVGALSYIGFKSKGWIMAGIVMLLSMFRGAVFLLSTEPDMADGSAEFGFVMALFVLLGYAAAWLLTFAFRREKD